MRRIIASAGTGCALLLLGAVPRVAAQAPAPPSSPAPATAADHAGFTGTWKLNADESEKLRDKMHAAHQGGERGGGAGGGGGHHGGGGGFGGGMGGGHYGGHGGGYGGQRGGEQGGGPSEDMRETMRRLDEPAESLTIKQENGEFLIGDDTGQIHRLRPDGRTVKAEGGEGETKTHWQGNDLITETSPAQGPHLRDTYSLSPDGKKLFVTTHFEPRWGGAVDVRRVYDAAGAS